MSHLQYFDYPGAGALIKSNGGGYSQAVKIGDTIHCSGQGGWNATVQIPNTLDTEIQQAFENVQACLQAAGGTGWDQVFKVNSFHIPLNKDHTDLMKKNLKEFCPNHEPTWTAVGVTTLAIPSMRIEIDVTANIPK